MGGEMDGAALADLIDGAAAHCIDQTQMSEASKLMRKVSGRVIVQNISRVMLNFLTNYCK